MERFIQQQLCVEMHEKASLMFSSRQWSDCSFVLGSESNDVVEAHKLILAMASPVFETLLYGENADKNYPIPIVDVEPKIFRALLEYIYTSNIIIGSIDDARQLCFISKKYMMSFLTNDCINYLWNHLSPDNVCQIYEFTLLANANILKQKCLKIFSTETKSVLNSIGFINAELDTVTRIFSMNNLNIDSELEFVVAAERYIKFHGKKNVDQSISLVQPSTSNSEVCVVNNEDNAEIQIEVVNRPAIRGPADQERGTITIPQLRVALEKIRFLTVTPKDFAECRSLYSVMTQRDVVGLLMNIISERACMPMPKGYTTSRMCRNRMIESQEFTDNDSRAEAEFSFKAHNFSNLETVVYSPPCYVRRLPWQIMAGPRETESDDGPQKSFCFVLLCNTLNESLDWSCSATAELRLVSPRPDIPTVVKKFTHLFNRDEHQGGFTNYMAWNDVIDPEAGYILDDAVTLEVHIKAAQPHGVSLPCHAH